MGEVREPRTLAALRRIVEVMDEPEPPEVGWTERLHAARDNGRAVVAAADAVGLDGDSDPRINEGIKEIVSILNLGADANEVAACAIETLQALREREGVSDAPLAAALRALLHSCDLHGFDYPGSYDDAVEALAEYDAQPPKGTSE